MAIICNFSCRFQIYKCFFSIISSLGDNYGIFGYFEGMFGYFEPCNFGTKRSRLPTIFNFPYLSNYWEFSDDTYIFIFLIKLPF